MENNTFLDDKLYNYTVHTSINSISDFHNMLNKLYEMCDIHWKSQVNKNMTSKIVKNCITRTFNSWDLFIQKLEKINCDLANLLNEYSYKKAFMLETELKRIYDNL